MTGTVPDDVAGLRPRRAAGRGRWVLVVLVLGLVTAALGVPTWVHATGVSAIGADTPVQVAGTTAAPQVLAVALVVLAAGAALALVGRVGRWAVVAVLVAGGALVVAAAVGVLVDPARAAGDAVTASTGLTGLAGRPSPTPWPWLAATGGLLLVVCGAVLARASRSWPGSSRRHERAVAPDERSDWDALSRGVDPSQGGDARSGDGLG